MLADGTYRTTCCYCGVGCGILLSRDRKGVLDVQGDPDHPVNRGMLCSKGMNLHHTANDRTDRLLYPMVRYNRQQPLRRAGWDEALDRTAAVFRTLIEKYGPDSVAFYASGQCLTEEYYVLNKLVKGFIGTNNIDTNSRLCMSSAVVAYKMAFGEDSVPGCYDDIESADCIYVDGGNPAWCHPILWRRVEARKAAFPDLVVIVADPRRTDTCSISDLHLQIRPGTDITLNNAIARVLIEGACIDIDFIRLHTQGFEAYSASVFNTSIADAALTCGVCETDIRKAAAYIAGARGFLSFWTMGLNQSVAGVHKILSLIHLHLITGQIGRPGSGPFSLTGQPNAMGGREVGGLSTLLSAHRDLRNPVHREEVAAFWGGGPISGEPGLTAVEVVDALEEGRLKALWIIGTNPLVSLPDVRRAEAALKRARFLVVQEVSARAETLAYADVILPAATWAEKEGTMTNSERRISYLSAVADPPGEALPDAEIVSRFARRMGYSGFDYAGPSEIYAEHVRLTAGTRIDITGVDYALLRSSGTVQWPYSSGAGRGTKRLFTDGCFYTPSGRAVFHCVADGPVGEQPDPEYPFILTTGRIRDQWHTMSRTGRVRKLQQHIPRSFVEMHPEDARRLGIREGDLTEVHSRRGGVRVRAHITDDIREGVLFLPMHWGKLLGSDLHRANNVTHAQADPLSGEPGFKFCAVRAGRYRKPFQRIVVVGAGAAALGFIKAYRPANPADHVTVFSKEASAFYNRVLLPDYVSGERDWDSLRTLSREEEERNRLFVKRGVSVVRIDRESRTVLDSDGGVTPYDVLILATGSSAVLPKQAPDLDGIFTVRTKEDAERLKSILSRAGTGRVVVGGGGLIGLEMAAALKHLGFHVSIVHRSSRFLERQLDPLASELLREQMVEMRCDLYFNDEVQLFYGDRSLSGVRLKSGQYLDCEALVFGIGTQPNIGLAQHSGLLCNRGVVVDEQLRTSDPSVFAVGEIAEFKGNLFGITAAAEQQGAVVAEYLGGDVSACYEGSVPMNIVKIPGFDLCTLGIPECPNDEAYEEVIFIDRAKRYYKKCIIHQDRLVGAILVGDKDEFPEFRMLIEGRLELSEKRLRLLRSGRRQEPMLGKLVCSCAQVGQGNLERAIAVGTDSVPALCAATGAGTGCGSCKPEIQRVLEAFQVAT